MIDDIEHDVDNMWHEKMLRKKFFPNMNHEYVQMMYT